MSRPQYSSRWPSPLSRSSYPASPTPDPHPPHHPSTGSHVQAPDEAGPYNVGYSAYASFSPEPTRPQRQGTWGSVSSCDYESERDSNASSPIQSPAPSRDQSLSPTIGSESGRFGYSQRQYVAALEDFHFECGHDRGWEGIPRRFPNGLPLEPSLRVDLASTASSRWTVSSGSGPTRDRRRWGNFPRRGSEQKLRQSRSREGNGREKWSLEDATPKPGCDEDDEETPYPSDQEEELYLEGEEENFERPGPLERAKPLIPLERKPSKREIIAKKLHLRRGELIR